MKSLFCQRSPADSASSKLYRTRGIRCSTCAGGLFLALSSLFWTCSSTEAQTWTGTTNSFWFTNTNWDTNVVPNGITTDVIVGAPSPTVVNGNVNINSLNVGAAGILTLNSGFSFDFGGTAATTLTNAGSITVLNNSDFQLARTLNNSGSITVTNANSLTDLEVISDGATLTGGGTITLGGTSDNSRIVGVTGSPTLTIANQTIQGRGQIGVNTLGIINQANGLINANSSGNLLTIDPSAAGMTNQGMMRASSGGILQLSAGNFINTGGFIEAQTGSIVRLTNATVNGGTLTTSGTGLISVDISSSSFLENLTIAGNLEVLNNSDLGFTGTINNSGSIAVSNLNSLTDIEIQAGGATLTGGGAITLQGTSNNSRIMGVAGNPTLTIANQTIQGRGQIGVNTIGIVNQTGNLIHANSNGNLLTIDPSAAGNMTNQGTMRASNGGVLQLEGNGGGNFINAGGVIEAQNISTVRLTNATVVGGTLATSGTGLFSVDASSNSNLENLTIAGNLEVLNNSDLGFTGTINNSGSIAVSNVNSLTDIEIQTGGAALTGGGTITLQGTGNNSRIMGVAGNPTLTIASQTIQGRGQIGANTIGIVNQTGNLIHANSNAATNLLTIDPSATGMTNQGTMRASNGGVLQLEGNGGGNFNNVGGVIEAETGSTVRLTNATVIGGTLSTSGTGLISVDASTNSFLENLTNAGNLEALNNSDLGFTGTINNSGSIAVSNVNSLTDIEIQTAGATLTGGGTITLQGTSNNSRIDGVGGSTLTIANQTIQGRGNVGANTIGIVNGANGVIHANSNGNTLTVDPNSAGNFVNQGTLRASGGGELVLTGSGGGAFSGNGTYEARNGGLLRSDSTAVVNSLAGGILTEGTWRAINSGAGATIRLQSNAIVAPTTIGANAAVELSGANSAFTFNAANNPIDSSLNNVQGSLTLRDGRMMNLAGALDNSGAILIDGAATSLVVAGNYTQTGGSLTLDDGIMNLVGVTNQASAGVVNGNGTINGDFTFTGTASLDPGFSPGQLDFGNNLTWGAGGSILFDLGIDQLSSDLIDVAGGLLKSGAGSFGFTFVDNGWVVGNTYDLIQFNSTNFNLTDFSFTNTGGFAGNFAFSGANTLQFTMTAIPEPGSAIVFAVAGLLMVSRRRRDH